MSELQRMERAASKLKRPGPGSDSRRLETRRLIMNYHDDLCVAGIRQGDSWWAGWQAQHLYRAAVLYQDALDRIGVAK